MNSSGLKHAQDVRVGDVITTMDGAVEVVAIEPTVRLVRREMVTFTLRRKGEDQSVRRNFGLGATISMISEAKPITTPKENLP